MTCGAKKYFPREPIAQAAARHAVCGRSPGHDGLHEMYSGTTLYTWADEEDDDAGAT